MAKKGSSFFGKIMGGSITDEEEEAVSLPVSRAETLQSDAEELDAEEPEEMEVTEEVSLEVDPKEQEQEEVQAPSAQQNENWMADYEGQLNIDMYQTKDNVIIKSTIAGVKPEDIDITVANDMVTIKGSRKREEVIVQDDYFYQECYWGNFSRSVIVPIDIDSEHIEADLKNGMLTVVIPKAAKAKTKKVKVKGL